MRHLLSIPIEEKRDKISQYTNIYYSKPMGFKNQYRKGECSSWERVRDRRRSSILQGKKRDTSHTYTSEYILHIGFIGHEYKLYYYIPILRYKH
jgi:hypothetical protein